MERAIEELETHVTSEPAAATEAANEQAPTEKEPVDLLPWLTCTLVLEVPVIKLTVGALLTLKRGTLVETAWHQSTDIPMRVNGLLMAWTEFEVVGERLAARITDLI